MDVNVKLMKDDGYSKPVDPVASRKVKVLSLPETIKQKSTFRAKALRRELAVGVGENHACFYTS